MRKEVKADLHVHSRFSQKDSIAPVWQIKEEGIRKGLDWIAIVDHNALAETARELKEKSETPFILGEEILTSDVNGLGRRVEVIGLFLQEPIESGQTEIETIKQIGTQGGVVVIPHPFEGWRHGAGDLISQGIIIDCLRWEIPVAIEVFNARSFHRSNLGAMELWRKHRKNGVLATAGSDAHRIAEIGRAYVGIPPFQTKEEFLEALQQARIYGEVNVLRTAYHRLMNRIEVAIGKSFQDIVAQVEGLGVESGRP